MMTEKKVTRGAGSSGEAPIDSEFLSGAGKNTKPAAAATPAKAFPIARDLKLLAGPEEVARNWRAPSAMAGLAVNVLLVAVGLALPFMQLETLAYQPRVSAVVLAAPSPPPPPPPARRTASVRRPVNRIKKARLALSQMLSKKIAENIRPPEIDLGKYDALDSLTDFAYAEVPGGVLGGVPGGVPGGLTGGILGGVLGGVPSAATPPPLPTPAGPIRVGGVVQRPKLLKRVAPSYPIEARHARIQGIVRIDAIVNKQGRVVQMKLVSGHPLLVGATMQALSQWVYEPTYLNGIAVPLVFGIEVIFNL